MSDHRGLSVFTDGEKFTKSNLVDCLKKAVSLFFRNHVHLVLSYCLGERDPSFNLALVDKEIDFMAMQYQLDADKIKEMLGPDNIAFIEKDIKIRKAIDYIFEKAVIK